MLQDMKKHWYYVFLPMPMTFLIGAAAYGAAQKDDPGPNLQYGGTSIELHYDAPGANVTKVNVDGTPCIIVSDGDGKYVGTITGPVIALSCNWNGR